MIKIMRTYNELDPEGSDIMKQYLIYLRKSRKDIEAERAGAGETLARHETELLSLAKKQNLNIGDIYREIVSGETISARPKMQRLLSEVETGMWAGVLVMEIERLARGDTKDQGIVAEAFKYGNAKIVTPSKIYDPENEFDEEYFEFGLFMSRREYKTINRRIQRGRIASVQEGKYIASDSPYGYERVKIHNGKGYTLAIVPEEAEVVRLIFQLYTVGLPNINGTLERLGSYRIARQLDSLHIPARKNNSWSASSVRDILSNPAYMGKVRWQWRREQKKVIDGKIVITRPKNHECRLYEGLHEAIISAKVFQLADSLRKTKDFNPKKECFILQNPLSGLIYCKKCGKLMTRLGSNKKNRYDTLKCINRCCDNISAPIYLIEKELIHALGGWVNAYELTWKEDSYDTDRVLVDIQKSTMNKLKTQLDRLNGQLDKTFDLLEQEIYTYEKFLERNKALNEQIGEIKQRISEAEKICYFEQQHEDARRSFVPLVKNLLEVYNSLPDASAKNSTLKQILEKVTYIKTKKNTRTTVDNANFDLVLYPHLPADG